LTDEWPKTSNASNNRHRFISLSTKTVLFVQRAASLESKIQAIGEDSQVESSIGFAPVAARDARILILGSLPGRRSLQAQQYYAHRQNAFWRIMYDLIGAEGSYEQRCNTLRQHRIALWDVLAQSVRSGSMDADIQLHTAKANDFAAFFSAHTDIEMVACNGQKAAQMFHRFVTRAGVDTPGEVRSLPSTSPAYAAMSYSTKLEAWHGIIIAAMTGTGTSTR
jgi:hypoxanthine-DNA glycosylase